MTKSKEVVEVVEKRLKPEQINMINGAHRKDKLCIYQLHDIIYQARMSICKQNARHKCNLYSIDTFARARTRPKGARPSARATLRYLEYKRATINCKNILLVRAACTMCSFKSFMPSERASEGILYVHSI